MTEQNLYHALNHYIREKSEGEVYHDEPYSYVVIGIGQKGDTVHKIRFIVDPEIADNYSGAPIDQPIPRQAVIYLNQMLSEQVEMACTAAAMMEEAVKKVGMTRVKELVKETDGPKAFFEALTKEIEKHGTG